MFFPLFVRECDCSHKMIFKKIINCLVNALRTVTSVDNASALPHIFLLPDLQRPRLFPGRLEFDPAMPGRVREHDEPVRGTRNARP